jgi:hypothetical protein
MAPWMWLRPIAWPLPTEHYWNVDTRTYVRAPKLIIIPNSLLELYKIVVALKLYTSSLGQVQGFRLTQHWFQYFI